MRLLADGVDGHRVGTHVFLTVGVVSFSLATVYRLVPLLSDPDALRAALGGVGLTGPVVYTAIQAAQVVLVPIPGEFTAVAGGFLFGWFGLVYSLVGVTIGSVVALQLSRRLVRPYLEAVVAPETLEKVDSRLDGTIDVVVAVFFFLPVLPDDVICFLAGVTSLDFRRFLALSLLARLPVYAMATMPGANAGGRESLGGFVLFVLIGVGAVLLYRNRVAVVRYLSTRVVSSGERTEIGTETDAVSREVQSRPTDRPGPTADSSRDDRPDGR